MPVKKRSTRLRSIQDVNRFLAKIINQFNRDEIDVNKAGKLGYLCNILIGSIRDYELEERVNILEEQLIHESEK